MEGGVCQKKGDGLYSGKACLTKANLNQTTIPNWASMEYVQPPPGSYVKSCANCYIDSPPHNTLLPEHTHSSPVEELTCCCGVNIRGAIPACATTTLPLTDGSCKIENKDGILTYTKNCS